MYQIKDFLYKFFNPKGLKGFRNMSILVAILIFLVEAFLLFMPINYQYTKKPEKFTQENDYTKTFYNLEGDIKEGMKTSNYKMQNYNLVSSDDTEGIKIYNYVNNDTNVYIIFDVNNTVSKAVFDIDDVYEARYPDENKTKIAYSGLLIYYDVNRGIDINDSIDSYHNLSTDDIIDKLNNLRYYHIYGLNDENAHVLLFEKECMYIEFPYEGSYINNSIDYHACETLKNFDINNMNNINEFSKLFTLEFGKIYAKNSSFVYFGTVIMYSIIYPILLALVLYFILRRRGSVKRFKEHYAILSITSIVPFLIAFIFAWIIDTKSSLIYLGLFSIYSIIMSYTISGIND